MYVCMYVCPCPCRVEDIKRQILEFIAVGKLNGFVGGKSKST
jgi:hypothetical protein